jgi:hypothetical protein
MDTRRIMMRDTIDGAMGWMGVFSVLVILVLILGVAALIKYLFR